MANKKRPVARPRPCDEGPDEALAKTMERATRIKSDAPAETPMRAGERDAATIGNFLIKRGWRLVEDSGPWCWQEPGTRARYKVKDAIAIASRQPSKGKRGAS